MKNIIQTSFGIVNSENISALVYTKEDALLILKDGTTTVVRNGYGMDAKAIAPPEHTSVKRILDGFQKFWEDITEMILRKELKQYRRKFWDEESKNTKLERENTRLKQELEGKVSNNETA